MSHIPSSAMKHAGPVHHEEPAATPVAAHSQPRPDRPDRREADGGIGAGAWIAIGGALLAGAVAALAVPLLRARATPVATRRGKKATPGKRKPRRTAEA